MFIIGTKFENKYYQLAKEHNILIETIDLNKDFINFDKRPYGKQYPIEMFYHLHAYKILIKYDYLVKIEPDIYTNKTLDIKFDEIYYLAATCGNDLDMNGRFAYNKEINKIIDYYKKGNKNLKCIRGGTVVYNVKNLKSIKFYENILKYYKESWIYGAPRCGDDTLLALYHLLNEDKIYSLNRDYSFLADKNIDNPEYIYMFHAYLGKWWTIDDPGTNLTKYFKEKTHKFVKNNFSTQFIQTYFPQVAYIILNSK